MGSASAAFVLLSFVETRFYFEGRQNSSFFLFISVLSSFSCLCWLPSPWAVPITRAITLSYMENERWEIENEVRNRKEQVRGYQGKFTRLPVSQDGAWFASPAW